MNKIVLINLVFLLIIACGSSKKIVSDASIETANEVTETIYIEDVVEDVVEEAEQLEDKAIEEEVNIIKEELEVLSSEASEKFNHSMFHNLLVENVAEDGTVNYKGIVQNKKQLWDYIVALGLQMPDDTWTKEDKLAYWMNAYNAMTIDLIIRNYPLKSIKDLDKPWDQRLWKLGDKWYNLNEIEHQILRKMDEPRIHFGINCASFSCPPLLNEAFTASEVDNQLEKLAIRFINDPQHNNISETKIEISEIFSWFAKDFKKDGSIIDYLNKYSEIKIEPNAKKRFMDYNWALNE